MVSWFSIVLRIFPSFPRWIDKTKKTCITSLLLKASSFLLFSLLTFTTGGLFLSFFSVDGVEIGDSFNVEHQPPMVGEIISIPMMKSSVSPDGDYWSFPRRRTKDRKSKHEKQVRDKRRSFTSTKAHEARNNDKEHRNKALGRKLLDWESVVILDEHEFKDEIDAGRTRINFLPEGRLISTFLNRGMNGRFLFLNSEPNNPISVVVTPCNSILSWSVNFLPQIGNTTKIYLELRTKIILETFRTQRTVSYKHSKTHRGVYALEIRPIYSDTFVHLFVSTSPRFTDPFHIPLQPRDLEMAADGAGRSHIYNFLDTNQASPPKPWIGVKRLRGNRIQVKWDTCPINPHTMHYCIVVNSLKDFNSLCAAQGDKFGFLPPDLRHLPMYPFYPQPKQNSEESIISNSSEAADNEIMRQKPFDEIVVGCLRKKTHYILTDLVEGRLYYFNVFVKDAISGLSYPYVRTTLKYRIPKRTPNQLRDAKPYKVTLGSTPVTLKFNLNKPCTELSLYVMPCGGGTISYRIFTANHTLHEGSDIDSLDLIKVAFPLPGKYYIEVSQVQVERGLARMAEVYISKKQKKLPIPKIPAMKQVLEILSERSCDGVTIKWHPSPELRDNEYCIFLKEETRKTVLRFKKPNQCDLERSLHADPYVSHSLCIQKIPGPENQYLMQRIGGLLPSHVYILQLILRRHNGKALSYDLTYISTTEKCSED